MKHILLLGYFLALMVGMGAVFTSYQFYKTHRLPFLRFMIRYVIFLNLALLLYFIVTYLEINFPDSAFCDPKSVFFTIMFNLAIFIWVGCIHAFLGMIFGLKEKEIPSKIKNIFNLGLILVGILCVIGITTFMNTGSNIWSIYTYIGLMMAALMVFFTGAIYLLRAKKITQSSNQQKSIQTLGWFYFAAYVFFFSSPLLTFLSDPLKICILSAGVIALNLIPIVWLRRFFLKDYLQFSPGNNQELWNEVARKFQISQREREIMELILQGKSNKDIEEMLFISYNTVKNHLYNLYQKLGVNSRGQMVHVMLQALKIEESKKT